MKPVDWTISRRIGNFRWDRWAIGILALSAIAVSGRTWLAEHPEHDPWAPLNLNDPPGWATQAKLAALKTDLDECRAVLERSDVDFAVLPPVGADECRRTDRTVISDYPLAPDIPAMTCPVAVGLEIWLRDVVKPAATEHLGQRVEQIEHFGAYSCRRIYGRAEGRWSEHATGNAIDISAFVLADGSRVTVLGDWDGSDDRAAFLREVRDGSCSSFATVLSPEYNAAHADHLHLDQAGSYTGVCR